MVWQQAATANLSGADVLVCGTVKAWQFGWTNPALLTPEDDAFHDRLDEECLLFWKVLSQGSPPSAPLAGVAPGCHRVHVLPALCAIDDLFPALNVVLMHPDIPFC